MHTISRRDFLALGAAAAAFGPIVRFARRSGVEPGNPFALGVTSGDPDATSAVLWTRLAGDGLADSVPVRWELAADAGFTDVRESGQVEAIVDHAHSVHVIAEFVGERWFRFRTGEWTSPAGRVRTVPEDPRELRIAAASCQHFGTGFYAAHRDIAEWAPDLVVFLGDFIYEYDGTAFGATPVRRVDGGETMTLDDYRARYAQYLGDLDLQASRAAAPWLVIWDDHEVDNNYAGVVPERIGEFAAFPDRVLAAYQAWWEHMPVRIDRPAAIVDATIYRSIAWGELANLILLDGRQHRTNQACNDVVFSLEPPCPMASEPARTMLGWEQEAWLADELAATTAVWPVIGQQTVLTDVRLDGAILNYDQWDGYEPARRRLLDSAAAADRTIVLTGDIHLAGVGVLPGVGVEFVTTSISSVGHISPDLQDVVSTLGGIIDVELRHRGYTRHVVTPQRWTAEYRTVDDVADPASLVSTWKTFVVEASSRDVVREVA